MSAMKKKKKQLNKETKSSETKCLLREKIGAEKAQTCSERGRERDMSIGVLLGSLWSIILFCLTLSPYLV